jgi:hypothetical protein
MFSMYLFLLAALGPGLYSASNRKIIMFLGSKLRQVRRAELAAIYKPIV